jgi:hypothetical protein
MCQGDSKGDTVGKKIQKIEKNSDVSFSLTSFVLSRFRVFLSDGSSKALKKAFTKKKSCRKSKSFKKPIDQKSQTGFFAKFLSRFWAFLSEGSSKTPQKYRKKKSDPGSFLASDPPTHHGGHRFFFGCPCKAQSPQDGRPPIAHRPRCFGIWNGHANGHNFVRGCTSRLMAYANRGPGGRQKKIDGPPRTFAKSQTHPPAIRLFFSLIFFSTFLGVSRQGEFKNTIQIFLQKIHVEK